MPMTLPLVLLVVLDRALDVDLVEVGLRDGPVLEGDDRLRPFDRVLSAGKDDRPVLQLDDVSEGRNGRENESESQESELGPMCFMVDRL